MARLLYGWELGSNYGHVARFVPTARELVRRGHDLTLALRNPRAAYGLVDDLPVRILGAPMVFASTPRQPIRTWTDTLAHMGHGDPPALRMALKAWRELVELVEPDVIITDAAPALQLATVDHDIPRITYDTPWGAAGKGHPQPEVGLTRGLTEAERHAIDAAALAALNEAATPLGLAPLTEVRQLYRADAHLICAFEDLDPIPEHHEGVYLGNGFVLDRGERYTWPPGDGPRVFAYLRANPRLSEALKALVAVGSRAIVVCPDAPEPLPPMPASMSVHRRPARLDALIADADAVLTHSATGTGAAFLMGGVPLMLVPNFVEQGAIAEAVVRLGAGRVSHPESEQPIRPLLEQVLRKPRYRRAAQRFAAKYEGFGPSWVGRRAADEIERVLTPGGPPPG